MAATEPALRALFVEIAGGIGAVITGQTLNTLLLHKLGVADADERAAGTAQLMAFLDVAGSGSVVYEQVCVCRGGEGGVRACV